MTWVVELPRDLYESQHGWASWCYQLLHLIRINHWHPPDSSCGSMGAVLWKPPWVIPPLFYVFSGFNFCNVGRGVLAFCRGFPWCPFFGRGVPGTCSGQDWIGIGKGRIRWKENKVSLSFPVFFNFPLIYIYIYICPFYRICFFFSFKKLNISGLPRGSKDSNPSKPPTTESRWDFF